MDKKYINETILRDKANHENHLLEIFGNLYG